MKIIVEYRGTSWVIEDYNGAKIIADNYAIFNEDRYSKTFKDKSLKINNEIFYIIDSKIYYRRL